MKKNFLLITIIFIIVTFSCNKTDKEKSSNAASPISSNLNDKFEMHYTQTDADNFKIYILNTFNGNVFVRLNNGSCYLAENKLPKTEYIVPAYSMKIMTGKNGYDQVVLLDKISGEVQIMGYTNSWYIATNEVIQ
jgi:hypothetical protein